MGCSGALSRDEVAEKAGMQFAVVRALCYPDSSVTSGERLPSVIEGSRTHARTDGRFLTEINWEVYNNMGIEERFVLILHEVTHATGGAGYGRGKSSHNPDFWEEVARNWNGVVGSESNKQVVRSVFEPVGSVSFDWHRAAYRLVQHVSQVDKRSETVDERKVEVANTIGYDGVEKFEVGTDWGLCIGRDDSVHRGAGIVNIGGQTKRFADEYSDETLLEFIDEQDGSVPAPLVVVKQDSWRIDGPQLPADGFEWAVSRTGWETSRKALAVQERIGFGYYGLSAEILLMSGEPEAWSDALPVPVEDFPTAQSVKYLGDKPRGFTVLSVPSRNGRTDAGEFNSPRPSRNGLAGINTRTLVVSVRVGRSTTTRQLPSHHAEDAGFERSRISKLPQSALD